LTAPDRDSSRKPGISRRVGLGVLTGALLGATRPLRAASPVANATRFARITDFFRREIDSGKLPGAVVQIQRHGRLRYQKCFGVRDIGTGLAMTPDTLFALHSMTKPITCFAAMQLIDQKRLRLDDPVSSYIPEFAATRVGVAAVDADGKPTLRLAAPRRPVTIADLLRHTSGISYEYIGSELIVRTYRAAGLYRGLFDNATFAGRVAALPLARQPGTLWRYGYSTDVLGRVIEIVSGQTLYRYQRQSIFEPLGMTSTAYHLPRAHDRQRLAEPLPGDGVLRGSEALRRSHPQWQSGGGGLVSTAQDYTRFAQMLLDGGRVGGRRLLGRAAFQAMTTDQIGPGSGVGRDSFYFPGDGFGFGYGLAIRVAPGESSPPPPGSLGELKWDSGSGTLFGVDPKLGMVFVLMQQTGNERGRVVLAFKRLLYESVVDWG
jgi:CubicO group peptidase (beta-lactamase class C family)